MARVIWQIEILCRIHFAELIQLLGCETGVFGQQATFVLGQFRENFAPASGQRAILRDYPSVLKRGQCLFG